jgi:hypothetical protein
MRDPLHDGERVLDPMVQLCKEQLALRFGPLALADVDDGAEDDQALVGPDRAQPDLDGNLGAVLAQGEQVASGPHGTGAGLT